LLAQINADGAKHITLCDVVRLEGTCTGADYQQSWRYVARNLRARPQLK